MYARSEIQMVCVAQDDLSPNVVEFWCGQSFNRSLGGYRHECRGLYCTVSGQHMAGSGSSVVCIDFELEYSGHRATPEKISCKPIPINAKDRRCINRFGRIDLEVLTPIWAPITMPPPMSKAGMMSTLLSHT